MATANQKSSDILRASLERKQQKNPRYSLRSLARDLGVSATYVSKFMRGEKLPSRQVLSRLKILLEIDALTMSKLNLAIFSETVSKTNARDGLAEIAEAHGRHQKSVLRHDSRVNLPPQAEKILDHWYGLAILKLATCSNFKPDLNWIARRLGISRYQTETAVRVLIDADVLKVEGEKWTPKHQNVRFPTAKSDIRVRRYHSQVIQKALECLNAKTSLEDYERRLIMGMAIAVNPKKIDLAKKRMRDFIQEISEILSEGECTEVFHLNMQLFPLTL